MVLRGNGVSKGVAIGEIFSISRLFRKPPRRIILEIRSNTLNNMRLYVYKRVRNCRQSGNA